MSRFEFSLRGLAALLLVVALPAGAQSFRVQCPTSTITHPDTTSTQLVNSSEPAYTGPTALTADPQGRKFLTPMAGTVNGAIKCQQISGGDGFATMADGTQTFMFSFGPLSGLADIAQGLPGTEYPSVFNTTYASTQAVTSAGAGATPLPGDPATTDGATDYNAGATPQCSGVASGYCVGDVSTGSPSFTYNGAIGLQPDTQAIDTIYDAFEGAYPNFSVSPAPTTNTVTIVLNAPASFKKGDRVTIHGIGSGYDGTWTVSQVGVVNPFFAANFAFQYTVGSIGLAEVNEPANGTASSTQMIDGHVDPRQIMDVGVMNGNIPAPLIAFDEDDELFLTLTNVGMIMRPDLFEQHTVHFHGYPNASSYYDGVPDASVAINIGGSFTYYYLAPDAGTYFWHCHITPPEHLQMGMVGQLYVRPRQNRVPASMTLFQGLQAQQKDLRTACNAASDILCANPLPAKGDNGIAGGFVKGTATKMYAYNDGDGMTAYDVEYPIQMHGFDPNFHFVGMTFNPEAFADMKDKYYLLNGRSYPDTITPGPQLTQSSDGRVHFSQPLNSIINIPVGGKALLRISDLSVAEYATLASLGIRMHVIGYNAKLLRDQAGNNMDYYTNSITLGGGESLDVILDASDTTKYVPGQTFYLYSANLDYLSNDAENFGGMMTEVHICNKVDSTTKACS